MVSKGILNLFNNPFKIIYQKDKTHIIKKVSVIVLK